METKIVTIMYIVFFRKHTIPCHLFTLSIVKKYLIYYKKNTISFAAFHEGDWGRMSARERGTLLFKLADLMEEHKEELATIEAIDSGAVYTLALKTHVGMSIDTWRYMAGW